MLSCTLALAYSLAAAGFTQPDPAEGDMQYALGVRYLRSGDFFAAAKAFGRVIAGGQKSKGAYRGRGFARVLSGNPRGAIRDFDEAIRLAPGEAALHYGRGCAHRMVGDRWGALKDLTEAIRLDRDYAAALCGRAGVLDDLKLFARAHADMSRYWELRARAEQAPEAARRAAERETDLVSGARAEVQAYFEYHCWMELHAAYRSLEVRAKSNSNAKEQRGRVSALRDAAVVCAVKGRLRDSVEHLHAAIQREPNNAALYKLRGLLHVVRRELAEALSDFSRAIELAPKEAELYVFRAIVRAELGQPCAEDLQQATQIIEMEYGELQKGLPVRLRKK